MQFKGIFCFFVLIFFTSVTSKGQTLASAYRICGNWESEEKNLIVQIYVLNSKFLAKVIWFKDTDGKPMEYWKDVNNPDPELRDRKILGMSVLRNLVYRQDTDSWEDGMVYDAKHGREWNAVANLDKTGKLRVKGYWHFKFIGKTMVFNKL